MHGRGFSSVQTDGGFIAQSRHEQYQMRRHSNGILIQAGAKPVTDFLAEGHAMGTADLSVAFVRAISHQKSNRRCYRESRGDI